MKANQTGLYLLASVLIAGCTVRASLANQLTNGGFETPELSPGGALLLDGSFSAGGWHGANVKIVNLPRPSLGINFNAFEGSQLLDLGGNGSSGGNIFQEFPTVPGQVYRVTFQYADNPLDDGPSGASFAIRNADEISSIWTDTVEHSSSTTEAANFTLYSRDFTAASSLSNFILGPFGSVAANAGLFIDNVDISLVPEPSSMMLMALLAGALLAVGRRTFERAA